MHAIHGEFAHWLLVGFVFGLFDKRNVLNLVTQEGTRAVNLATSIGLNKPLGYLIFSNLGFVFLPLPLLSRNLKGKINYFSN